MSSHKLFCLVPPSHIAPSLTSTLLIELDPPGSYIHFQFTSYILINIVECPYIQRKISLFILNTNNPQYVKVHQIREYQALPKIPQCSNLWKIILFIRSLLYIPSAIMSIINPLIVITNSLVKYPFSFMISLCELILPHSQYGC